MKLSIITINYNNRDGLLNTIESVVCQTFRDFEWIVIDGGSTDGSKELIEEYSEHFSYWVSEPDKGIYNAMNKGIKVAKGEYLQFLNSGDSLYNSQSLARCFSRAINCDILYGDLVLTDGKSTTSLKYPDNISLKFFYDRTLCHNSTFIKRILLQKEPYNENFRIVSDWEFFLKQALQNKTFYHINEKIIVFDTNGISSSNDKALGEERSIVLSEQLPNMLILDYQKMDDMEEKLNNYQVRKILEYGKKKKLYHKMITALLLFIEKIDKL